MTGSTITATIRHSVTIGNAGYSSPLTITLGGAIADVQSGATAIYAAAGPSVGVFNQGSITGGGGGEYGTSIGGDAIDFLGLATLVNSGDISGGNAGPYGVPIAPGGIGVDLLAGGTIINNGTISGGTGGEYGLGAYLVPGHGGRGGYGVNMAGGTLINAAAIYGGNGGGGGSSLQGGFGGNGGFGVNLTGGSLINTGTITGGSAGLNGGDYAAAGLSVNAGAVATNSGMIRGGAGGNANGYSRYGGGGYSGAGGSGAVVNGGTLIAGGTIMGGNGGVGGYAGVGGDGVVLNGGTLIAAGTIAGGYNGNGGQVFAVQIDGPTVGTLVIEPGAVFDGVVNGNGVGELELAAGPAPGTLTGLGTEYLGIGQLAFDSGTDWTIPGTFVGGPADAAVILAADATLTVSGGAITGGFGAFGATGGDALTGGTGDTLVNAGSIAGGTGGNIGPTAPGGGTGGTGVTLGTGSTIINTGTIAGGVGGYGYYGSINRQAGGAGGVAIDLAGGTVTNSGVIIGGNGARGTVVGQGGIGVELTAGGSLANNGTIRGGRGTYAQMAGGVAVSLNDSSLTNNSLVVAGYGSPAVDLTAGAWLNNPGTIVGGIELTAKSTAISDGTIIGETGIDGALVSNSTMINGGLLTGGYTAYGASLTSGATLTNSGTIVGGGATFAGFGKAGGAQGSGVALMAGATLTNTGTIISGFSSDGAYLAAGGRLINAGSILGSFNSYGVYLAAGAQLTNTGAGTIVGGEEGAAAVIAGGTLINAGFIGFGKYSFGVQLNAGTLVNAGTIVGRPSYQVVVPPGVGPGGANYPGGTYTVPASPAVNFGHAAADLIVDPGAVFLGDIVAVPTVSDTIELAAGTGQGTLSGFGTAITGVQTIAFDGGANWFIAGNTAGLTGTITGFAQGDTIELDGITVTGSSYVGGTLTLTDTTGSAALDLPGSFTTSQFRVTDVAAGADITLGPVCFLSGTLIATPEGEREVEQLLIGGTVLTRDGQTRRIVWIGTGRVLATRGRRSAATPIIVRKGALADNVPHTDLRVTKAHSLFIDGVLIPVEYLVNHRTILWDDHAQEVTIYHIELETHDILIANGAPAESYRDDGNRWLFQNANSGWHLPPLDPCAPVLTGGPVVNAIWQRLLERSGPRRNPPLTDDADLHLIAGGRRLDAAERIGDVHVFHLRAVPSSLVIRSRATAPAELGMARDPRVLGIAVRRLVIRKGTRFQTIKPDDARLTDGFHAFEPDGGFRWTDGNATLPPDLLTGFTGRFEVVVHVGATTHYHAEEDLQMVG